MFKKNKSCETCGCLIEIGEEQEVRFNTFTSFVYGLGYTSSYYCKSHKKPYNKFYLDFDGERRYHGEVEMCEDGTPVGYVKKKTK